MPRGYTSGEGWDIGGEYSDVGMVRNPLDHPGFRQVMDIVRAEHADVPVVRRLNRVAHDARIIGAIVGKPRLLGGCLLAANGANEHRIACRAFSRGRIVTVTIVLNQGRLTDDEPRLAFHLLAHP